MSIRRALRLAGRCGGGVAAGSLALGTVLYIGDRDAFDSAMRMRRTVFLAARLLADYSWRLRGIGPEKSSVREAILKECHNRNAPFVRDLCFRNGGIYIKLGQLLGLMDHILPYEYVSALRGCFDACPESSFADVEAVFLEEFGQPPSELFECFDPKPLASGSLAQVHRATLFGGKELAVKVQHRPLKKVAQAEIACIDFVLRCVRLVQPAFGFQWVADEVKENLPNELDFRLESANAARCQQLLDAGGFSSAVVVPKTHAALTTARVLVMDLEEGCSLSSTAADMQAEGVQPHAVVRRFAEVHAEMVFGWGFIHCDPHPGNVLWRRRRGAPEGFQLVLLDHGLYRELPRALRLSYCRLWQAIALGDGDAALRATRCLGIRSEWLVQKLSAETVDGSGNLAADNVGTQESLADAEALAGKMFAAMLTTRSFRSVADSQGGLLRFDRRYRGTSESEEREELAGHISGYFRGILEVLDTLPRAMLWVLKSNDCLRATARRLEIPPSVPLVAGCRASGKALRAAGDASCTGWRGWLLELRCWLFLALEGSVSSRLQALQRALAGA